MIKKRKALILIIIIIAFAFGGCRNNDDAVTKIRIAYFPNATHAQALIMKNLKLLEAKLPSDVKIEYVPFNAGSSEVEAFLSGHVDVGYIGPVPAINANLKSEGDIVIIAGAAHAGATLVVSSNSEIDSFDDFENKRIAIPQFGNTQHIALLNLLTENGLVDALKGGNVEIVPVKNSDIEVMMLKGEIDAAFVPEPWGGDLIQKGVARRYTYESKLFGVIEDTTALVVSSRQYLEEHQEIIKIFVSVHNEATEYFRNNPDMAKAIIIEEIEKTTGKSLALDTLDQIYYFLEFDNEPMKESIMLYMKIFRDEGFVDGVATDQELFYDIN
ncbi:MAG: aliphatic sulfonate ABC transporter substrate-binding protein [Tissierellales bacterium]|nr:aliphatic sulfonate ABC transporter substrate-binding protein [Tissierellales bacterium]MBN2827315.1 aliphatic sulfonate ABC transporter substrate-binding protein [Tissierellales bacterium]